MEAPLLAFFSPCSPPAHVVVQADFLYTTLMDLLAKLFGDVTLVRLMRFFLFHPTGTFDTATISEHLHVPARSLTGPLSWLRSAEFAKKRARGWMLDTTFPHMVALRELLLGNMLADVSIADRITRAGSIKLLTASGIFMQGDFDTRTDILIVGDRLKEGILKRAIATIEADCGTEIRYVALSTKEFRYRMDMNDRLVRDVLDYPHRNIINKLNVK